MTRNKIIQNLSWLALLAALALSGCKDDMGASADKDSTVFRVSAEFPTQKGVELNITHNGPADCRYAGCVYMEGTSVQDAISERIAQLKEASASVSFEDITFSGREYSTVVTGLSANREYSYTVFGLNEDFTVYGTPGTCTFTTQEGAGLFTVHDVSNGAYEDQARVQVLPRRGYEDRTYFIFWTEDLTTPVEELVASKVKAMSGTDFSKVIMTGDRDYNIPADIQSFTDGEALERGGKYRAVVTGMYPDGVTYGIPAETVFKTDRGDLPYEAHPAWEVTYRGKGIHTNGLADASACENIRVTTTDNERFFFSMVEGRRLTAFLENGTEEEKQAQLRQAIEEETELMRIRIEEDPYNTGATWADYSYTETVQAPFPNIEDDSWWFGLAIGVDVDGIVTGLYSLSEPFKAEVPVVDDGYTKWVGTWTVEGTYTDEAGSPTDISFDIEISDVVPGVGYTVSGFGVVPGLMDDSIEVPLLPVMYDDQTGNLQWTGSALGYIVVDESTQMTAPVYFAAVDGYDVITGENFVIAETSMDSGNDSRAVFNALPFDLADGTSFLAGSMGYVADVPYAGYLLVSVSPDLDGLIMTRKTDGE